MDTRDLHFKQIRPDITTATASGDTSTEERFQNLILRPVIKLQNDLLIDVFKNYITKHKSVYDTFTTERKIDYIKNAIQKDMAFRNFLTGLIIGVFTSEEYITYSHNSSALNKRIMNLVKERLISNIQIFEKPYHKEAV